MFKVVLTKQAQKDILKLKSAGLSEKAKDLVNVISNTPFQNPPYYEKLLGNLNGYYSRRINIQHRMIYSIDEKNHIVKILRMWTHYE